MAFNLSLLKKTIAFLPILTSTLLIADVGHAASSSPSEQKPSAKQEAPYKQDKVQIEKSIIKAKEALLGERHRELEFIGVASLVGLGIFTPELFRKKKAHKSKENRSIQDSTPIAPKNPTPIAIEPKTEPEIDIAPPITTSPVDRETGSNVIKIEPELQHRFSASPPQGSNLKSSLEQSVVLIVDDSLTVREMLSETFNRAGYHIIQACDGQDAWEKLNAGLSCDLILCDLEMPRMNGLQLLSLLQQDKLLSTIPFAVLSSYSERKIRQQAIALGAKGYFLKPHAETVLVESAERLLAGDFLLRTDNSSLRKKVA